PTLKSALDPPPLRMFGFRGLFGASWRWLNVFKPLIHLTFNHHERSPPAADVVEGPFVLRLVLRLRLSPICPARVVELGGDSSVEPEFEAVLFLPLADEVPPVRVYPHDQAFLLGTTPSFQLLLAQVRGFSFAEFFEVHQSPGSILGGEGIRVAARAV